MQFTVNLLVKFSYQKTRKPHVDPTLQPHSVFIEKPSDKQNSVQTCTYAQVELIVCITNSHVLHMRFFGSLLIA